MTLHPAGVSVSRSRYINGFFFLFSLLVQRNTDCLAHRHLNPSPPDCQSRVEIDCDGELSSSITFSDIPRNGEFYIGREVDVVERAHSPTHIGPTAADGVFVTRHWNAIVQSRYIAIELPSQKLDFDREISEITASRSQRAPDRQWRHLVAKNDHTHRSTNTDR